MLLQPSLITLQPEPGGPRVDISEQADLVEHWNAGIVLNKEHN